MDVSTKDNSAAAVRPARRLPRPWLISGVALVAASLAVAIGLSAAPASTPSTTGRGAAGTPTASAAIPTTPTPAVPAPQGSPPLHISYAGIGMDQDILPLTPSAEGQVTLVPPMTVDAYWLTPYGSPGSTDTTYIVGHSWDGRDSAFNHLSSRANPGDRIIVATAAGPSTYTVRTVSTENKNTLKDSAIWNKVPNRLVLVSCYTADLLGTNIIITADLTP